MTVGWFLSHEVWRLFYPETDTNVDFEKLQNFVLTDQKSFNGVTIGLGYVNINTEVVTFLYKINCFRVLPIRYCG